MAISGGDGSIILDTRVNTAGVNKGLQTIKNTVSQVGKALAGVFAVREMIRFSNTASQMATQTEASVQRLVDIYGEAAQSVGDFIDANARAIGMSRSAGASIASTYGNLLSVWADQATNAELTNSLLNQTAVVASKTGRTTTDVAERIRSGLLGNTEAIEDLGINVNIKTIEITDAFKRIADGRSWEQLNAYEQSQVRTLAILEQSTKKYGTTVAETSATVRNQYQAAYEDFQNTWGQVVNTVLIPVLKVLTQVFTIATKGLQIIAGLTGKTIDTSTSFESQEASIGGAVENQEALTDAVKGTNKELKKATASFDDIEILSSNATGNASDTGATGISGGVSGIGDLGGTLDGSSYVEEVDSTLMAIMGIVAEALVAVGLILLFTGHIGWGIGFIIAGAGLFAVTAASASEFGYDGIISMLTTIMGIAGGALLALGIILLWIGGVVGKGIAIGMIIAGASLIVSAVATKAAFSPNDIAGWLSTILGIAAGALLALGIILCMVGSTPLGVGMIIAGSIALVSAVALNFNEVTDKITGWVAVIMAIAGGALLVLGIILTASGANLALGIALIAVGAIALVTPIALNWDAIKNNVTKFLTDNSGLIVGVSLALLVLGIILCCVGIINPLSIGLIAAGAVGLATEIALNWGNVKNNITNFLKENSGLIVGVSLALIVLGIILLFTGVGIPLAIGLIVAGGGALAATVALNWNFIVDKVKEVWEKVKQFWNENIAPIFTAQWWADLGKKAINGLLGVIEKGLNWIIDKINEFVSGLSKIVGAVGDVIGVDWSIPKIPKVKIPRLAQGAVIPPNREFLAVLGDQKHGTNIEAPLQTIVDAFNIALQSNANYGGGNTEVVLEIDGREFGRAVVEQGNRENRRIGTRLVIA